MQELLSTGKHALIIVAGVVLFLIATSIHRVKISKTDKAMRSDSSIGEKESFNFDPSIRRPDQLRKGNVVVFEPLKPLPDMPVRLIRVIGLPGDRIQIKKSKKKGFQVCVNGAVLHYTKRINARYERSESVVPAGHLYLLFDDAKFGGDSFTDGPIPWRRVIGKAKVD